MDTNPKTSYLCHLSRKRFPSRADVRGGMSLDTGDALYVWSDISRAAALNILGYIEGYFPKHTPIVRYTHSAGLTHEPRRTSQQLASDEDNAIERAREEGIL